jgi:hypothetical protein
VYKRQILKRFRIVLLGVISSLNFNRLIIIRNEKPNNLPAITKKAKRP